MSRQKPQSSMRAVKSSDKWCQKKKLLNTVVASTQQGVLQKKKRKRQCITEHEQSVLENAMEQDEEDNMAHSQLKGGEAEEKCGWYVLPNTADFDSSTRTAIAQHVAVHMLADAFMVCVGRVMHHGRQSQEQCQNVLQLLEALIPAMTVPTSRHGYTTALHKKIRMPEVEKVAFCQQCESLCDEEDACKQCGDSPHHFYGMDPTSLLEAILVVYDRFCVSEEDKKQYRVQEKHGQRIVTRVIDWIGGDRSQSINYNTSVPYFCNTDGAAIIESSNAESHWVFQMEVACIPRYIRKLLGSIISPLVWNQSLSEAGPWIAGVAAQFVAKKLAKGLMHRGQKKEAVLANSVDDYPAATKMAACNKGGECSCFICRAKGERSGGTSTYRLGETGPLRTDADWLSCLERVEAAPKSTKHIEGIQRQKRGSFPLSVMPGWRPAKTVLADYMHSAHGWNAKRMVPCYIEPPAKSVTQGTLRLRPPRYVSKQEVADMHAELKLIARPLQYKRPIMNLMRVHQRKMMETHNLVMGELRLLLYGRIEEEHHRQLVSNYIVPIAAAYGYAGEVIVEDTDVLFGPTRFGQYQKFVREKLGFGYLCPVLHLLCHGDVMAREVGGFRLNVARYETGIWLAGERVHGSRGIERSLMHGLATATLLSHEECHLQVTILPQFHHKPLCTGCVRCVFACTLRFVVLNSGGILFSTRDSRQITKGGS